MNSKTAIGSLIMLASTVCYGFLSTISLKTLSTGVATETVLFNRFFFAAVLLWGYVALKKIPVKISRKQVLIVVSMCFGYNAMTFTFYEALNYIPGNLATVLNFLYPAIIIGFEAVAGRKAFNKIRGLSIAFSITGLFLIVGGDSLTFSIVGILFGIGTAVAQSWYVLSLGSDRVENMHPLVKAGFVTASTGVVNFIRALMYDKPLIPDTANQLVWVIILAFVCTFLSIMLFCVGISMIGPGRGAVINTLEPVVACLAGYFLLGESMTVMVAIGCVFIVIGVLTINFEDRNGMNKQDG